MFLKKLWGKTKTGFKHAFENYLDKADWFFKGDDDTFLIVENLKKMLWNYKPADPIWFGCKFRYAFCLLEAPISGVRVVMWFVAGFVSRQTGLALSPG